MSKKMLWGAMTGLAMTVATACAADSLTVGVGSSANDNARSAGEEAARSARAALGTGEAKLVLVFAARKQVGAELVAGVASQFDKALIYGCEGYAPVTAAGNFPAQGHTIKSGVAVLALGGEFTMTVATAAVAKTTDRQQGFAECGRKIGEQLKPALGAPTAGRVILTFGNQHVGTNQPFVAGVTELVGSGIPVVGAAAGGDAAQEIIRGELVKGWNVAILLTGKFTVGTGLAGGKGDLVGKADEAMAAAMTAAGNRPVLGLVFDCGGRRGDLVKQGKITAEYEAIKKRAGNVPFFGFYGGGEIGVPAAGAAAQGVGFSAAMAVLSVE